MTLAWDDVRAHALALPDADAASHYGRPCVKVNGRAVVTRGRGPDSFVLHTDADTKLMLLETDPATFWQTPHYQNWPALLVRYDTADVARVMEAIARAAAQARTRRPPRVRAGLSGSSTRTRHAPSP